MHKQPASTREMLCPASHSLSQKDRIGDGPVDAFYAAAPVKTAPPFRNSRGQRLRGSTGVEGTNRLELAPSPRV